MKKLSTFLVACIFISGVVVTGGCGNGADAVNDQAAKARDSQVAAMNAQRNRGAGVPNKSTDAAGKVAPPSTAGQ